MERNIKIICFYSFGKLNFATTELFNLLYFLDPQLIESSAGARGKLPPIIFSLSHENKTN